MKLKRQIQGNKIRYVNKTHNDTSIRQDFKNLLNQKKVYTVKNINFKSLKNLFALKKETKEKQMKILERKLLDGKTTTLKHSCKNDKAMKELKSFPLNLVLSVSLKKPHDNLICFLKSTHFTLILLIFGSVYLEEFFFHI